MTPAPLPSDSNQQRAGNRERAAEVIRSYFVVSGGEWTEFCDLLTVALDAAEQRGAEQVAQRMRELAEEWEAEHDYGPIFADRIRAALAEVAPPMAGREGL